MKFTFRQKEKTLVKTPNNTLIPIFLRWEKQPLERRYALAFVTRENARQDIVRLSGDRGINGLSGILMNITFCTDCHREHDLSLDECVSPIEGVKRASFNSFGFSQNFMEYLGDTSEDEPLYWMPIEEIEDTIVAEEECEGLGQTILLLWDNMTFAIAYYFPDRLDNLFETLDEYGDPSGQHFKPLRIPFLIDIQEVMIYDEEIGDLRESTKEEATLEVGLYFTEPKIPDVVFDTLKDDSDWSEFSFAAQEAWYDSISVDAAKMSCDRLLPRLEEFTYEMETELSSTYGINVGDIGFDRHEGFVHRLIDKVQGDVKKLKELEAGCHQCVVMDSIDVESNEMQERLIEVVFCFYTGSVVKARISVVKYSWTAIGDDGTEEIDVKNSKVIYDDVVEFCTARLPKSTGESNVIDLFEDKSLDDSILDHVRTSFKKACAIAMEK